MIRRALISDIHGNLEALDAVLVDNATQGILRKPRLMINVGSVGQSRDGDNSACYVILDDGPKQDAGDGAGEDGTGVSSPRITYRRVPYDFEKTTRKIRETGSP